MGIRQTTPQAEIDDYIRKQTANYEKALIRVMLKVGEDCITIAKLNNTYQDQTGNLRSSIGYLLVKDGVIINQGGFDEYGFGNEDIDGKAEGSVYAKSLVARYPFGVALIVVAGMKYAGYVEAMGYDVLSGTELYANERVNYLLKQLQ